MALKQEIETWALACERYDNQEFDEALKSFEQIADTSKIFFNIGVIHATLGEHEKAVESYQRAIKLDNYMAIAHFQMGVSNFLMGDFEEALANFNETLLFLRGNKMILYEQLHLDFTLYSCEVLFNRGLCYYYLQQPAAGKKDLEYALLEAVLKDHEVIDQAMKEEAVGYTVFSIPVGRIFKPDPAKVRNLPKKDFLGTAKLVAATDINNTSLGFQGADIKRMAQTSATAKDDRPEESISYAATNLVKPEIQSRTRLQSAPPVDRNVFPPTPPPDSDRSSSRRSGETGGMTRAQSVRGAGPKPKPLDLGRAAFDQNSKSRLAPTRSASERPRPRDRDPAYRRVLSDESSSGYEDDVVDMYNGRQYSYGNRSKSQRPMESLQEYIDDAEFEMIPTRARAQPRRDSFRTTSDIDDGESIRVISTYGDSKKNEPG